MFYSVYQPMVGHEGVFGYETLVRTTDYNVNLVNFLSTLVNKPLFDYENLLRILRENKHNNFLLFINVHPESLVNAEFVGRLGQLSGYFPRMVLEVIETPCDSLETLCRNVKQLQQQGLRFAIDDFGTSFSNLSRLTQLDTEYVKLDQSLISKVASDFFSFSVLIKVCQLILFNRPKTQIIVEGIETWTQHVLVNSIESYINHNLIRQGYFYARPHPEFLSPLKVNLPNETATCEKVPYINQKLSLIKGAYESFLGQGNELTFSSDMAFYASLESIGIIGLTENLELSRQMVVLKSANGDVIYQNRMSRNLMGMASTSITKVELLANYPQFALCLENDEKFLANLQELSVCEESIGGKVFIVNRYRIDRDDHSPNILSFIVEKERANVDKLDEMTGLRLRHDYATHTHISSLAFLDLNGLKQVNDTQGYEAGDRLIIQLGSLLRGAFRHSDILVRHGGDEFLIFCTHMPVEALCRKLTQLTIQISDDPLSFSWGVSEASGDIHMDIAKASERMKIQKRESKGVLQP